MVDYEEAQKNKGKEKIDNLPDTYQPRISFPTALEARKERKKQQIQAQHEELMKLFKEVHINIPLLDAIHHVPAYAKFLKDMCTQKREPRMNTKRILLSEDVSVVLLN